MPTYEFSLNINNAAESVTPRRGFDMSSLGQLLVGLNIATNPADRSFCSMYRVDNHGYTPHFATESYDRYRLFINVHRKIASLPLNELSHDEQRYANTLKRVLRGEKYIEPRDQDNRAIVRINPNDIGNSQSASYHIITTIEGVIRQIGGRNLTRGTHIMLNGLPYKIMTNSQQDTQLGSFYKGVKLTLQVKQKCSLEDGHVLYAVLLSFKEHSTHTLLEGVDRLEDVEFISDSDTL